MRNLIELLNGFYELDIQNQLDSSSSFLFITLLRKFNMTRNKSNGKYFPDSLPIFNSELCHLAGMEVRTLRNARDRLLSFRLVEGDDTTWILRYEQKGTKESGIYTINYDLLSKFDFGKICSENFLNDPPISESLVTKNADLDQKTDPICAKDVLPSRTILNKTKQDPLSMDPGPSIGTSKEFATLEKSESELDEEIAMKEDEAIHKQYGRKLIEEIYPFYFARNQGGVMNEVKNKMITELGYFLEMDEELTRKCITNVAGRLKEPTNLVSWTLEAFRKEKGWEPKRY